MASNAELKEHLRKALSYREKAQKLQQESARAWSAGEIDNSRYEHLARFYTDHLRLAEKDVAHCREEASARNDQLQSEHTQLTRDLERVRREEAAKHISSERAAGERARLEREIAWHAEAIGELRQMERAETSAAAGGYVDLPLDAYRGKDAVPPSPPGRRGWRWTWESIVFVLACVLIGFAVLTALPLFTDSDWSLWGSTPPKLECAFEFDHQREESLQVACRNVGERPIELYLPWPDAVPPDIKADNKEVGGIEVQLRKPGGDRFQMYPVPSDWWLHNGRPVNAGEAVVVEPLLTVQLELDTAMVRSIEEGMEAIRILVKRGDGTVFGTFDAVFSESRSGAGRTVRRVGTPPVSSPPPQRAPAAREDAVAAEPPEEPRAAARQPQTPEPSQIPRETAPKPETPRELPVFAYVSFIGMMGEKAALSIQTPHDERVRRTMVEAGDEIGGGWLVEELNRDEQAVSLFHPFTGRRVRVLKGAGEPTRLMESEK